jgi:YVTN family beta-propeller protein
MGARRPTGFVGFGVAAVAVLAVIAGSGILASFHAAGAAPRVGASDGSGAAASARTSLASPRLAVGLPSFASVLSATPYPTPAGRSSSPPPTIPRVAQTVVLPNGTVVPGSFLPGDSLNSEGVAYDAANGLVYEVGGGDYLMILNATTDTVVGSVDIGGFAESVVYGAAANELFVSGATIPDGVTVLNATTNAILGTVAVQSFPRGMAYDNGTNQLFVSDFETGNVSVVNLTTFTVTTNVSVGDYPLGITYDSAKGELFVALVASFPGQLAVLSDTNDSVVANISLPNQPEWPVYDSASGRVYVANGDNLSAVSGASDHVVGNYPAGDVLVGLAYDPARNQIFAAGDSDGNVSVFDITGNHFAANVSTGGAPYTVAYDSADGDVFVGEQTTTVGVISDTNDTVVGNITVGATPYALAFDPVTNSLYVAMYQYGGVLDVYNASTYRPIAAVPVGMGAVAVLYDPGDGDVFVANAQSGNVSVINGTNLTDFASVATGGNPGSLAYDSALGEVFAATDFTVVAINDTNESAVATQTVAAGAYQIAFDPGTGRVIASSDSGNGSLTFLNASTLATVGIAALTGYPYEVADDATQGEAFAAAYNETHHSWAVDVVSDAESSIVTSVPNVGNLSEGMTFDAATDEVYVTDSFGASEGAVGSAVTVIAGASDAVVANLPTGAQPAGVAVDTSSGNVYVANYGQGSLTVVAQSPTYAVTFTESGLPGGTSWSVTFNSATESSTTASIVFYSANGTSAFTVPPVTGYGASPSSGSVPVNGGPAARTIDFTASSTTGPAPKYLVTFLETGLSAGTRWAVTFNGTLESGSTDSLEFNVSNGTFGFTVGAATGYVATPASGSIPVAGHSVQQTIAWAANSSGTPGSKSGTGTGGLPATDLYLLVLLLVVIAAIAALVLWSRRRRSSAGSESPTGSSGPPT